MTASGLTQVNGNSCDLLSNCIVISSRTSALFLGFLICAITVEGGPEPLLDAPLLFVKRHSYTGIHIYDTYYKWPPGGGGIYVLENPQAQREHWQIRPVIDETTPDTLGHGVYTHPELSWDAKRVLFCFKGKPNGNTSIYEIGLDGTGLRRISDPAPSCASYKGSQSGQHDVAPAYLPDGRIVFLSTRQSGLVPCNNTGVAILHVMNADGSDLHAISVNYVNEFDPAILPDGRILYGRWEYVDKNALTIQSLWTTNPDGTHETALFANNMVFPEAVLDARPVPGSELIVATLAKHNGVPRGSIAFIDPRLGKNNPAAITNLEHPENPIYDLGDSCEPWPLPENSVIFSGRPKGFTRNVIEMINRAGERRMILSDPEICLHSPMLVKPRPVPPVLADQTDRKASTGRFLVQDIYDGLDGVHRGEVKSLRVIEETSRVSGSNMGGSPYNQTFLVSAALAFSVKNYLGIVPVNEDGSAYFEAPSGRALYLQTLDGDGRLIQSMRTFVQAAPGTVRACVGCHEHKATSPSFHPAIVSSFSTPPRKLESESWGRGKMDYPTMIQPLLDKHCSSCHGGEKGIAGGIDLTGGWTEHFNISYENLVNRRESQLMAWWIAGIDCMNGTAHFSSQIMPPRAHGSGAASLANLLMEGHGGNIPNLTRTERDLLMAWIDSNGLYHGTWNSTEHGCAVKNWQSTKAALASEMNRAGCTRCHGAEGKPPVFEGDWFNLQRPELSRILRAPLQRGDDGFGLGLCRENPASSQPRIRLLVDGYAHAVKPVAEFPRNELRKWEPNGKAVVSFESTRDAAYQRMLGIIQAARQVALLSPRVDMPGAIVIKGEARCESPPVEKEPNSSTARWPQFRGVNASGVGEGTFPTYFGPESNIVWKVKVPAGHSSPCIWEDRLFLTGFAESKLEVMCLDRITGHEIWKRQLDPGEIERGSHLSHPATATPVTDGKGVYVYFASLGLLAYDLNGTELWRKPLPIPITQHGPGTSPVLAGGKLILACDQDTASHLLCVDAQSGDTLWRTERPGFKRGFATPLLFPEFNPNEVIVAGSLRLVSYSLLDGSEVWSASGLPNEMVSSPIAGDGLIFAAGWTHGSGVRVMPTFDALLKKDADANGRLTRNEAPTGPVKQHFVYLDADKDGELSKAEYEATASLLDKSQNAVFAVKPEGRGDITEGSVLWKQTRGMPYCPTPLFHDGKLYMVKNGGLLTCLDARTGEFFYQEERIGALGDYYSSPVAADGKICLISHAGTAVVIKAGPKLEVLARNELKEPVLSTPAIIADQIIIRTATHLYNFGVEKVEFTLAQ